MFKIHVQTDNVALCSCFDDSLFRCTQLPAVGAGARVCGTPPAPSVLQWKFRFKYQVPILISANATNKRKTRQNLILTEYSIKDHALTIRKDKPLGIVTNLLPKMHHGHQNNHSVHYASYSHSHQNILA